VAHVHSVGSARLRSARGPRLCRADLGLRGPRLRGAARERTPERSPLSGRASWRGRRRRYCGEGGARGGTQASTAKRPPAGQVGGGGNSPELLDDGKGGKTGTATTFSDEAGAPVANGVLRRGGEGEEAQAQVYPEKKAARGCSGLRSPWSGSRRWRRPDSGGGALGQRHGARTATWSASDMGDGAVGTGVREARRGQRRQSGGVFRHGRSEWLLPTRAHLVIAAHDSQPGRGAR
jgi:hypothetical protein